jgi:hypothetical protein
MQILKEELLFDSLKQKKKKKIFYQRVDFESCFFSHNLGESIHGDCTIPDVDFIVPLWSARFAGVSDLLPKSVLGVNGE